MNLTGISASLLGGSGVVIGAFGAHALSDRLDERQTRVWGTAVQYQLIHAAVMLAAARDPKMALACKLWGTGAVMFSGSLYLLCLGYKGGGLLGPTTPLGGLTMIGGWALALKTFI
jgi:uncharacterized membrane protein YgdD (TMEM256/DUF423 family)